MAWFLRLVDRYGVGLSAYLVVAVLSAFSEWTSFVASLWLVGPFAAAFVGFFFGTLVNFTLGRRFVFYSVRPLPQELVLFVGVSSVGFIANFLTYVVLFVFLSTNILVAKIIGTGFGFGFNYLGRQFLIYSWESPYASISAVSRRAKGRDKSADHRSNYPPLDLRQETARSREQDAKCTMLVAEKDHHRGT